MNIELGMGVKVYSVEQLATRTPCASSTGVHFPKFSHTLEYLNSRQWFKEDTKYPALKAFLYWDCDNHCWRGE